MKIGFSKNEYSEGVKMHGLTKNFGKFLFFDQKLQKLNVDPQRDDDASPVSTYRCMLKPTWIYNNNKGNNIAKRKRCLQPWRQKHEL